MRVIIALVGLIPSFPMYIFTYWLSMIVDAVVCGWNAGKKWKDL